jgi:quercetin dioxygenase-like cupin family protein
MTELGYFGNIWVRQNYFSKAGEVHPGHKHHFDHVTLLAKGSVQVKVEDHPPKVFEAPTFIIIKKEHSHEITALEDDTLWYCVFALRDADGEVTDIYSGDNSPYSSADNGPLETLRKM